jgi:hypothetical protein
MGGELLTGFSSRPRNVSSFFLSKTITNSLTSTLDYGAGPANEMGEHMMKLLGKVSVFITDSKIMESETSKFYSRLQAVCEAIVSCLHSTVTSVHPSINILQIRFEEFHDESILILRQLMSPKNSSRFTSIVQKLADRGFLLALFTSYDFIESKKELNNLITLWGS